MGVAAVPSFNWTGLNFGVTAGSLSINDTVTNPLQLTFCPPFCTPDLTPNPSASLNSSGGRVGLFVGYNQRLFNISQNTPVMIGGEGFLQFGSSSNTRDGFPGTGGIAPWSVAANDRVIANFGSSGGFIGKVGPVFDAGGTSLFIAFDFGIGWQRVDLTFNCTVPGVCGFNGIPAQTLDWKKTRTGSLLGGEINVPVSGLPLVSQLTQPFPALRGGTVGFQYLRGDYGNFTAPSGMPSQIQILRFSPTRVSRRKAIWGRSPFSSVRPPTSASSAISRRCGGSITASSSIGSAICGAMRPMSA
jgi:hypothetical protein